VRSSGNRFHPRDRLPGTKGLGRVITHPQRSPNRQFNSSPRAVSLGMATEKERDSSLSRFNNRMAAEFIPQGSQEFIRK
jgi:hypothetical protein